MNLMGPKVVISMEVDVDIILSGTVDSLTTPSKYSENYNCDCKVVHVNGLNPGVSVVRLE